MVVFTNKILKKAENLHYKFRIGCYFSGLKKAQGALFLWSDTIKDFYWNYATKINVDEESFGELIRKIITFYKKEESGLYYKVKRNFIICYNNLTLWLKPKS